MKTLQLSEEQAIKMYETATPEIKIILESSFGKSLFEPELITSYEDACKSLGLCTSILNLSVRLMSLYKLEIISKAINKGKERSKSLYSPYFEYDKKGNLSMIGVNIIDEDKIGNYFMAIYYYNYRDAEYAGDKFIELYKDLLL